MWGRCGEMWGDVGRCGAIWVRGEGEITADRVAYGSQVFGMASAGVETLVDPDYELKSGAAPVPRHMHHKYAIVDGRVLLCGSYNWSYSVLSPDLSRPPQTSPDLAISPQRLVQLVVPGLAAQPRPHSSLAPTRLGANDPLLQ